MAKIERLEPRAEDVPVFDGGIDEEDAEEGSRLPLLIVIALLVLAAFAGVVWLAYTQGVERGRADAPRIIVAQGQAPAQLKIYQQPAAPDEESADTDTVPPAPTLATKSEPPAAAAPAAQQSVSPSPAPEATGPAATKTPPKPAKPSKLSAVASAPQTPPVQTPHAEPAPVQSAPRVATHAPAALTTPPSTETASVAPATPAEATTEAPSETMPTAPEKPAATGRYLLQIGAYKSQDEADSAWSAFQERHAIAGGYKSDVKQVDLGEKGTWYRLRIGPFADKDAANAFCAKLKSDGASCLLAR